MSKSKVDLGEFDGLSVVSTTIAVRNAGDGLSKAMATEPQLMKHHDTVFVVLECEVVDVQFPPIVKDGDELTRKHILRAGVATIVDGKLVAAALDEQRDKNLRAEEATKGQARLADQELIEEHDTLGHLGGVPNCPRCIDEGAIAPTNARTATHKVRPSKAAGSTKKAAKSTSGRAPRKSRAKSRV